MACSVNFQVWLSKITCLTISSIQSSTKACWSPCLEKLRMKSHNPIASLQEPHRVREQYCGENSWQIWWEIVGIIWCNA